MRKKRKSNKIKKSAVAILSAICINVAPGIFPRLIKQRENFIYLG